MHYLWVGDLTGRLVHLAPVQLVDTNAARLLAGISHYHSFHLVREILPLVLRHLHQSRQLVRIYQESTALYEIIENLVHRQDFLAVVGQVAHESWHKMKLPAAGFVLCRLQVEIHELQDLSEQICLCKNAVRQNHTGEC